MTTIKVYMADGNSFVTSINLDTQEELDRYYIGRNYVSENQVTGDEAFTKMVRVEILEEKQKL